MKKIFIPFALVLSMVLLNSFAPQPEEGMCDVLKKIGQHANSGFDGIKGDKLPHQAFGGTAWKTTVTAPGSEKSKVWDMFGKVYHVSVFYWGDNKEDAAKKFEEIHELLKPCVEGWKFEDMDVSYISTKEKQYIFSSPENEVRYELENGKTEDGKVYTELRVIGIKV